ncbi:MAG: DNA polymerase III subunit delta [Cytophagales bacterium]|nr:MAG: DNA polymerase III subunit delta [Cytophagales bacterium]
MLFRDIIGHDDTKQTLVRAVQDNHLAHALLFDGPVGSANLALALALAQFANCESRLGNSAGDSLFGAAEPTEPATDSCGRCASCAKMSKLIHPDLHLVFPVANMGTGAKTSEAFVADWRKMVLESPYRTLPEWLEFAGMDKKQGNISAEESRNILQKLSLKAYEGRYKIMLIWLPELMNAASANALLKVLEEPPDRTLFLLVTNAPDKLLITILSRTQRMAVRGFTDEEVALYLRQAQNLDETRARQAAFLANGDMAAALSLLKTDPDSGPDRHTWFAEWMRACYRQDLSALVKQADVFDGFNKEKQKGLMEYSLRLSRDLFLWQHGAETLLRLPDDELNFVRNFSKVLKPAHVERIIADINEAAYHIERNARPKMVLLDLSLTFSRLIR